MLMPQRSYNSAEYRFGFNGQEKDDEVYGSGQLNTAEFWQYDTRLGRRWNIDPKPQIGLSQYSVMNGNPVLLNDPKGDCPPGVNCADVVDKPEISSDNGGKNNNRTGHGTTRHHQGVDIIASKGTDVRAVIGGIVHDVINNHSSDEYSGSRRDVSKSPTTGLGNTVIIKTTLSEDYTFKGDGGTEYSVKAGQTVFVKYSHLDIGYEVTKGKHVDAGQIIGKSGATGNPGLYKGIWGIEETYRHVHIESRIGHAFGKTVDPEAFMFSQFDKNGNRLPPLNVNPRYGMVNSPEDSKLPNPPSQPKVKTIDHFYPHYKFGSNFSLND